MVVLLVAPVFAACNGFPPFTGPCFPPPYSVSPARAAPGDTVTVSAPDADCRPRYGEDAEVELTLHDSTGRAVLTRRGPMSDDGGFSVAFVVPRDAAAGPGFVEAGPADVDWCDDTGKNNRVSRGGSPGAGATLERVSCAQRMLPLAILP